MRRSLKLLLAGPRGACAGVDRAIGVVEAALEMHGAPVYVRHEIVHNRHVVDGLRRRGAIFVDEVGEVPEGAVIVFSAHGVARSVRVAADKRGLRTIDATCPLVAKVHREVVRHHRAGRTVVLVGHAGHAEVEGTLGQLSPGIVQLVRDADDVARLDLPADPDVAYAAQTTLATDEAADVAAALRTRFPSLVGPAGADVCYATANRQAAVRAIAPQVDKLLVVGSAHSSNSRRLVEIAMRNSCPDARLVEDAWTIDWDWLGTPNSLGLSAGASAPEALVRGVIDALEQRFDLTITEQVVATENQAFRLPNELSRSLPAGAADPQRELSERSAA